MVGVELAAAFFGNRASADHNDFSATVSETVVLTASNST
jgi:hypothetical protein